MGSETYRNAGRKPKEVKRDKVLAVRLTEDERSELNDAAAAQDMSQSNFIIHLLNYFMGR